MSLPAVAQTVPDLAAFFDVSLDMLCIRDADFRFVRVNQAWTRTLGHPVSVLEGARMLDFIHPDDASPSGAKMTGIGPDGEINGFINRYRHADGSYRSLEWRAPPGGGLSFGVAPHGTPPPAAPGSAWPATSPIAWPPRPRWPRPGRPLRRPIAPRATSWPI